MADHPVSSSYIVTTELADAYFLNDPRPAAIAFLTLSTDQKAWYLKRSTQIIDALPLKGSTYYLIDQIDPTTGYQARQFPRVINGLVCNWDYTANAELVPLEVQNACCEEALALYDFYISSPGDQKRRKLQDQGVKSFSVGKLSESYGDVKVSAKWKGMHSQDAYDLIKQYVAGAIRPIP